MGHALLPSLEEFAISRLQHGHSSDFDYFVTGDVYSSLVADVGTSLAASDAVGGVAVLTTGATDNNEVYVFGTKETLLIAANKPIVVETYLKFTEANTDDANVAFGFMSAVGANSIVDDGAGPKTNYSGACFFKKDGGTNWWVQASDGTTQTTVELTAANSLTKAAQTSGGGTYQRLRIECLPVSSTKARFSFWIDGVHVYSIETTYASATEAMDFVGVKAGGANSEVVYVDWLGCAQRR